MRHLPYIGSGPYCYANSFAMMFGEHAPPRPSSNSPRAVRSACRCSGRAAAVRSPWLESDAGFDGALAALGWRSDRSCGGSAGEALERLHDALAHGPAWIGPVEMGYFRHQPGMTGPIQADHYVVALAIEDGCVLMHDPQGFPMPRCRWPTSWPPGRRTPWTTARPTPCARASRASRRSRKPRPSAPRCRPPRAGSPWIRDGPFPPARWATPTPPKRWRTGCSTAATTRRMHLIHFAVRVGARRASDAAACLARAGCPRPPPWPPSRRDTSAPCNIRW